jgi:hypothetical protein
MLASMLDTIHLCFKLHPLLLWSQTCALVLLECPGTWGHAGRFRGLLCMFHSHFLPELFLIAGPLSVSAPCLCHLSCPCCYPVRFTDLLLSFLECPSIPSCLMLCFSLTFVYICPSTLPIVFLSTYTVALPCTVRTSESDYVWSPCLPVCSHGQVSLPDHC